MKLITAEGNLGIIAITKNSTQTELKTLEFVVEKEQNMKFCFLYVLSNCLRQPVRTIVDSGGKKEYISTKKTQKLRLISEIF